MKKRSNNPFGTLNLSQAFLFYSRYRRTKNIRDFQNCLECIYNVAFLYCLGHTRKSLLNDLHAESITTIGRVLKICDCKTSNVKMFSAYIFRTIKSVIHLKMKIYLPIWETSDELYDSHRLFCQFTTSKDVDNRDFLYNYPKLVQYRVYKYLENRFFNDYRVLRICRYIIVNIFNGVSLNKLNPIFYNCSQNPDLLIDICTIQIRSALYDIRACSNLLTSELDEQIDYAEILSKWINEG